jgi:hypothetical protein
MVDFLRLLSVAISLWAIIYWFRRQRPLDALAARIRWIGTLLGVAAWALLFFLFKLLGRAWVHAHTAVFIVLSAIPTFLFLFFVFLPGFSRLLAKHTGSDCR